MTAYRINLYKNRLITSTGCTHVSGGFCGNMCKMLLRLNSLYYLRVGLWGAASRRRSISTVSESSWSGSDISSDQKVAATATWLCMLVHCIKAPWHCSSYCRETGDVHRLLHNHQRFVGKFHVLIILCTASEIQFVSPRCNPCVYFLSLLKVMRVYWMFVNQCSVFHDCITCTQ